MADKSPRRDSAKVAGRTLKQKRADKREKHDAALHGTDVVSNVKSH
jgi:hypothetical protein